MEGMINTTLLKNWILTDREDMQTHKKGGVVLRIFNQYVGEVLKQPCLIVVMMKAST